MRTIGLAAKALLPLSLGACTRTPKSLRLGSSDTVVVNSREPVALPAHAFDRDGRELRVRGMRYAKLAGDDRSGASTSDWSLRAAIATGSCSRESA